MLCLYVVFHPNYKNTYFFLPSLVRHARSFDLMCSEIYTLKQIGGEWDLVGKLHFRDHCMSLLEGGQISLSAWLDFTVQVNGKNIDTFFGG